MAAHLMQPLRAITGYASAAQMVDDLRILDIRRAQYKVGRKLLAERPEPFPAFYELGDAEERLLADTETFAEARLQFTAGKWTDVDVIVRTGKGVTPESKVLRVYGPDEGEGATCATFDLGNNLITLGVIKPGGKEKGGEPDWLYRDRWMESVDFDIPADGTTMKFGDPEYGKIFSDLCSWALPDPRYFPPVSEAAKVCEFFRAMLVRDRYRGPITELYEPYSSPFLDPAKLGSEKSEEDIVTTAKDREDLGVLKANAAFTHAVRSLKTAQDSLSASNADVEEMNRRIKGLVSEMQ